eukprot:s2831_g5.t1
MSPSHRHRAGRLPGRLILLGLVGFLLHSSVCSLGFCAPASSGSRTLRQTLKAESDEVTATDEKPLSYYAGMLTNPPKKEDEEKDMITPTLKFIGYGAVVGFAYLAVFVGVNSGGP